MPGIALMGTTTTEVQLAPKQRVQLLKDLRLRAQKKAAIAKLEAEVKDLTASVEMVREESGLDTFEIDGYTVTLVAQVRDVLDYKKLVALGCRTEWLEKATVKTPSKPYTLITAPK